MKPAKVPISSSLPAEPLQCYQLAEKPPRWVERRPSRGFTHHNGATGFEEDFLKFFASVRGNDAACGAAMRAAKQIVEIASGDHDPPHTYTVVAGHGFHIDLSRVYGELCD